MKGNELSVINQCQWLYTSLEQTNTSQKVFTETLDLHRSIYNRDCEYD